MKNISRKKLSVNTLELGGIFFLKLVNPGLLTGTVELRAEIDAALSNPFKSGEGGEVKIEVKNVSPAVLVLQASGLLTETHSLSSSPQPNDGIEMNDFR
jgi:hypothetical protein